jgi:rhodanese-related sulfurtransferase/DNA-binding transcriptional ArsR family regulator
MAHREIKARLYPHFARVGHALASERRLELVDLLVQAPRRVDALADETGMTIANVSQHLQVLKNARLVTSERLGNTITYSLASPRVIALWLALRGVAEERLPEISQVRREVAADPAGEVPRAELERLIERGKAIVLDVRPALEFEHGHLARAISIPIDQLPHRLKELPQNKRIVAYCRGKFCIFADEAVALLRKRGFDAVRLEGGWPEWLVEGRPTSRSA